MKKRHSLILFISLALASCGSPTAESTSNKNTTKDSDTVIVKYNIPLNGSTKDSAYFRKVCEYYWLVSGDTLDFHISIEEWKSDNRLTLAFLHSTPVLFADVLSKTTACLPLIKKDFDLSKLASIWFNTPIFYPDQAKQLSSEYEKKFGKKDVGHHKLNSFLEQTSLAAQLNELLFPLNKQVKFCQCEKAQLAFRKDYNQYYPNLKLSYYPDFTIDCLSGLGFLLNDSTP